MKYIVSSPQSYLDIPVPDGVEHFGVMGHSIVGSDVGDLYMRMSLDGASFLDGAAAYRFTAHEVYVQGGSDFNLIQILSDYYPFAGMPAQFDGFISAGSPATYAALNVKAGGPAFSTHDVTRRSVFGRMKTVGRIKAIRLGITYGTTARQMTGVFHLLPEPD